MGTENTHHRGGITVRLTSCLTSLDSTKQVKVLLIHHKQSSVLWIVSITAQQRNH